jgi:hypothetical protein
MIWIGLRGNHKIGLLIVIAITFEMNIDAT